jgi:hypothetical protein
VRGESEHASAIVRERARLIGNVQRSAEANEAHGARVKPSLPRLRFLEPNSDEVR